MCLDVGFASELKAAFRGSRNFCLGLMVSHYTGFIGSQDNFPVVRDIVEF